MFFVCKQSRWGLLALDTGVVSVKIVYSNGDCNDRGARALTIGDQPVLNVIVYTIFVYGCYVPLYFF